MAQTNQTCPLRGLTICDGQRLEQPDGARSTCLCWLEERARESGYPHTADGAAADRAVLVELCQANAPSLTVLRF